MGCDIHGWIEANRYPTTYNEDEKWAWFSVVDLSKVVNRNYVVFGRLAHNGTRRLEGDITLFPERGVPELENLGDKTQEDYLDWSADAHHETHFKHSELLRKMVRMGVGTESHYLKPIEYLKEGLEEYNPENDDAEQVHDSYNNKMRYGQTARKWLSAFEISQTLADSYGEEQVRWVIWFDN